MVNTMTIPYHFTTLLPTVSTIAYLYHNTYSVLYTSVKDAPQPPPSPVQFLQEELRKKNMLFPKSYLQLNRVIGQGGECQEKLSDTINSFASTLSTGESGLVYRGYINDGVTTTLVAIKTGKGILYTPPFCH